MGQVILIIFLFYLILMFLLAFGWQKTLHHSRPVKREYLPGISVIIPVRNEQANIISLLQQIRAQDYPPEKLDVWVVNDHSEDATAERVQAWLAQYPSTNFRLITLPESLSGKKAALTEGIARATGELIVTTDADGSVGQSWLHAMADSFQPHVQMVCGAVRIAPGNNFFQALQATEFAALMGTGAATLAFGIPTMCNGANLAFRKQSFEEVDGYAGNHHIPSGDDEFLLRKIIHRYPKGVVFNANVESVVTTRGVSSLRDFFNQRVRWAGKWRAHGIGASSWLAAWIFLFHLTVLAVVTLTFMGLLPAMDAGLLLGARLIAEASFLHRVQKFLAIRFRVTSFFVLQIVYPLYVVFFALAANLLATEWKGRKI